MSYLADLAAAATPEDLNRVLADKLDDIQRTLPTTPGLAEDLRRLTGITGTR